MEIRTLKIGAEFIGDSVRESCRKKFFVYAILPLAFP